MVAKAYRSSRIVMSFYLFKNKVTTKILVDFRATITTNTYKKIVLQIRGNLRIVSLKPVMEFYQVILVDSIN